VTIKNEFLKIGLSALFAGGASYLNGKLREGGEPRSDEQDKNAIGGAAILGLILGEHLFPTPPDEPPSQLASSFALGLTGWMDKLAEIESIKLPALPTIAGVLGVVDAEFDEYQPTRESLMARHKHVSFVAGEKNYKTLVDALKNAPPQLLETGKVEIAVATVSKAGARWYAGQACEEVFKRANGGKARATEAIIIDRFEVRRLGPPAA
jgi:hypothetical protein